MLELVLLFPIDESFRKSTTKLNRVLLRNKEKAIQLRTLANTVEREGELIQEYRSKEAEKILEMHGFSAEGKVLDRNKGWNSEVELSIITEESPSKGNEDLNLEKDPQSALGKAFDNNKELGHEIEPGSHADVLICSAIEVIYHVMHSGRS